MPKTTHTKRHSPFASRDKRIAELEAELNKASTRQIIENAELTWVSELIVNTPNSTHTYHEPGRRVTEVVLTAISAHHNWSSMALTLLPPSDD